MWYHWAFHMNTETQDAGSKPAEPAPKGSPKARAMNAAAARHVAPFLLWIGVMLVAQGMHLTPSSATEETEALGVVSDAALYAFRTGLVALALLVLRPWRHSRGLFKASRLPLSVAVGVAVFAVWIVPQSDFFAAAFPRLADLYARWCVGWNFGTAPDFADLAAKARSYYHPSVTGWPMFAVHMVGTSLVIAAAEEFFWRAYLLRAARTPDFLDIAPGTFHAVSFFAVSAAFAAEHHELAAGLVAGVAYGLLYVKTKGDAWNAVVAHATTNALLGFYVLATGHWEFW